MTLNNTSSLIFLSVVFVFSSCKKSDSGPSYSITSISPVSGPSATLDTITGKGFTNLDSVFFNGKGATVVSASATQLVVKVPPQAGTGNVSIIVNGKSIAGPVFTFTGNTYLVSTFAGSGGVHSIDGTGTAAGFNTPVSIAIDGNDNLFVVEYAANKIRKITPGGVVTTFAGSGATGSIDATGIAASFDQPNGIAVDGNNNLYVADYGNNKIRKITPEGVVSTFAGSGSIGSANGIGAAASFSAPNAVTVDEDNNVFVADNGNNKIRKITPAGVVSTFAGSGNIGFADGSATAASFNFIAGISSDAAGNLYVTDASNYVIRKITIDGTVTTIAGKAGVSGDADGTGSTASFTDLSSIAVDANGFLYVSDAITNVIRQVTPAGVVTLLAGTVGATGSNDGPPLQATFNTPVGLAIDSHGNIFVADQINNRIRKLTAQ